MPISIRIALESLLRNHDDKKVTEEDVKNLTNWNTKKLAYPKHHSPLLETSPKTSAVFHSTQILDSNYA